MSVLKDVEKSISEQRPLSPADSSKEKPPGDSITTQDEDTDEEIEEMLTPALSRKASSILVRRVTTTGTTGTTDPRYEVDWDGDDDPNNPLNWSGWYKAFIVFCLSYSTLVVVYYSTSYTAGIPRMMEEFHVTSEPVATLGVTTYLLGLAIGTIVVAPVSEMVGRRLVFLVCMSIFLVLVIPAGIGPSLTTVIVIRLFGAIFGAALVSNSPGAIGDISRLEHRAMVFSIWSLGPMQGPVIGPIVGGFMTQYVSWRWANWLVMILTAVALVLLFLMKETYAPTLLRQKAARMREETGDQRYWSRYDSKRSLSELLKTNLSRPFVMAFTEPICIFWNVYISVVYGILYLCFVAYPIVFGQIRGWSISIVGLSFLGIGVGQLIAIASEPICRKIILSHKHEPGTNKPPLEAMMSVVVVGAILSPVGQLWFAWTNEPPVHWIWPVLAGIPFGFGNILIFIYAINYLISSYGIYGASASAGNTVFRSILGATLPLAGPAMYSALGPHWAASLCGFLGLIIIPIPVAFYMYGDRIRSKSTLIKELRIEQERLEGKRGKAAASQAKSKVEEDTDIERGVDPGLGLQQGDKHMEGELTKEISIHDEKSLGA